MGNRTAVAVSLAFPRFPASRHPRNDDSEDNSDGSDATLYDSPLPVSHSRPPMHPLRRLAAYAQPHRRDAILASIYSVLNKVFDVLPEILIGVAVDIVVNQRDSFLARAGIAQDPFDQLLLLGALTVVVWVLESLFEYLYALKWRGGSADKGHKAK
jgi:hypothetical protein